MFSMTSTMSSLELPTRVPAISEQVPDMFPRIACFATVTWRGAIDFP